VLPDLPLAEQMIRVQLFLFVVSLSALILAAIMRERQEVQERLLQSNLALEQRVAERTAALSTINLQLQQEVSQRQAAALRAQELRADAQLARQHLERVLAGITDQILMLDSAWRYVFVNDRVTRATGRPREALLGEVIWEVFPALVGTAFETQLRRAADDQTPVRFACYDLFLQRWFEHRAYPSASGLTLFSADITEQKEAEARLRESEATLQAALDGALLGAWSWNPATNHVAADARTLELFGIAPEQFTNDASMSFSRMHPEDQPAVQFALERALYPDGQYDAEFRVVLPGGHIRWLAGAGRARWDADGQIIRVYGVNTDITERKRAEQMTRFLLELDAALARLAEADEIEQIAVTQLGRLLDVVWCSFAQIVDHSSHVRQGYRLGGSNLFGRYDLEQFFSSDTLAQLAQGDILVVDDAATDERTAAALALYQNLGVRAFVVAPVLHQGRWVGALMLVCSSPRAWQADEVHLVHEVAARVWPRLEQARAQAALRASEARLQVLYGQEQAARALAEEASRVKDEFLAIVSHELRTPLTAFLGYTQLLRKYPRSDGYIVQTVEKMLHAASVQAQLVEDLLDVSRIVSGKLRIELRPLDLRRVLQEALDTVQPTIEAKAQQLQIDLPPEPVRIMGDPNRLLQVAWNLLANAAKFTPSGGTIRVRLARRDQSAELVVSDTGRGISPDFLPFVFERFRQAEGSSNRKHRGLGLGLAIVRHLVELHGGTVEAASPGEGLGATFTARLPLTSRAKLSPPLDRPPSPQERNGPAASLLQGLRVLLVDDQPDILEVVRQILARYGALVQPCTTARKALDLVPIWRPDVLVSDIAMPGEDGYWLVRGLRNLASDQGGAIPAVALTGCAQPEDRLRVLAAGFQGYIPKPVDPDGLYVVISGLVRAEQRETS
jgi:PAS domain S-box-containing protein